MADPLSVAGSLVGIISLGIRVTQFLVDFYEACKGQKSDVANIATKLTRLLNVLKSLHRQLTDRNFRVEKQDLLKHIEGSIEACEDNIRELLTRVEKFKGSSGDSIQAAIRTATRQLAYPFKQSTLRKLEADIDEIVSHLTLALQVLQGKNISNVQNDIEDVKELLDLVRADQVTSTIREWLKAPDATVNYNEAYIKKHPGTGLWFVRGSSFSAWLAKPKSFLWLKGFAGCGKSVLCSTAIQYTLRHRRSNPRVGIGFFFFTFNDKSKQDASAMLRALVLQLSSQLTDNYELLSRFYDCCRNATPSDPTLLDCLHQLVQAFEHVYVIIDALDESPRNKCRRAMLQTLVDIWAWSEPGLHLLVSSRDETDLHDAFHEELHASSDEVVSIENDSVHSDIASYVSSYLKDSREFRRWQKYHGQIEKALVERANGVYVLPFLLIPRAIY
jgi:hypothetical protein